MFPWQGLFLPITTNTLLSHSNKPSPQTDGSMSRLTEARIFHGCLIEPYTSQRLFFCLLPYSRKVLRMKRLHQQVGGTAQYQQHDGWVWKSLETTLGSTSAMDIEIGQHSLSCRSHTAPGTMSAVFQEATVNPSAWAHGWALFTACSVIKDTGVTGIGLYYTSNNCLVRLWVFAIGGSWARLQTHRKVRVAFWKCWHLIPELKYILYRIFHGTLDIGNIFKDSPEIPMCSKAWGPLGQKISVFFSTPLFQKSVIILDWAKI